jgi:membrane protein
VRDRLEALAERHVVVRVAIDVQRRFGDLQGSIVAAAVTLNLFLSLFPLLLVATAVVGFVAASGDDVAGSVVDTFGLTGTAATTVTDAIAAAERSRRTASIVGLAGLVWSALGVAGAIRTAIDRAWQAKGGGLRDRAVSLLWLIGAGAMVSAVLFLTGLLVSVLPTWAASLAIVLTVGGHVLMFWWTFHLLAAVNVGWRPHLPGAIAAGIGFQALTILGAIIVPRTVASSSALYGSIGVVFAVIAWLFFFGRLLVYACILNVVLYERSAGTVRVEVEVPRVEGKVPLTGTRAGVVDAVAKPVTTDRR